VGTELCRCPLVLALACVVAGGASAPARAGLAATDDVTVTATRIERSAFDIPASITRVAIRRDGIGVNLAESLGGVAGLLVRDRQNFAQDTQLAVRGFGARSTFGIRGVRLYVDGVPATQPDGQGQVSHFNLASAERIEVLRGPFSALYGNSSGGVIQLFSADGAGPPSLRVELAAATAATRRYGLASQGQSGRWHYNAGYSQFRTAGARGHSAASRDSAQLKLSVELRSADRLTLHYNDFNAPDAQDPLGLTRAQLDADPLQSAPVSLQFNTRKSAAQQQGALTYDAVLPGGQGLHALAYRGMRRIEQFLAVPVNVQADARHSGGVVNLASQFDGAELRYSADHVIAGISYDELDQRRRGYENFIGSSLGISGALRRDEQNLVSALDQYLQFAADLLPDWSVAGGLRHSQIHFRSSDAYVRVGNADDSGRASFDATTPVASLQWRARPALHFHLSYGDGFETPTLVELAYRADGGAGLNLALQSATSHNLELGAKWRGVRGASIEAATFRSDTRNELAVVSNVGGRAAYGNLGPTRREGAELSAQASAGRRTRLQLALTVVRARLANGAMIPGVPETSAYAAWKWNDSRGWGALLESRWVSAVVANDANTAAVGGYGSIDLALGRLWQHADLGVQAWLRAENLLDRRYVGSVIVNEANARYFEPAAGRTVMASVSIAWRQ
jgi:iron complex outermembrane receptor protein